MASSGWVGWKILGKQQSGEREMDLDPKPEVEGVKRII
jgi:hypothetical protein